MLKYTDQEKPTYLKLIKAYISLNCIKNQKCHVVTDTFSHRNRILIHRDKIQKKELKGQWQKNFTRSQKRKS